MSVNLKKITLGFIPANRGFFSAQLAAKMRKQTIEAMEAVGIEVVVPGEEDTKVGCVENIREQRSNQRQTNQPGKCCNFNFCVFIHC